MCSAHGTPRNIRAGMVWGKVWSLLRWRIRRPWVRTYINFIYYLHIRKEEIPFLRLCLELERCENSLSKTVSAPMAHQWDESFKSPLSFVVSTNNTYNMYVHTTAPKWYYVCMVCMNGTCISYDTYFPTPTNTCWVPHPEQFQSTFERWSDMPTLQRPEQQSYHLRQAVELWLLWCAWAMSTWE